MLPPLVTESPDVVKPTLSLTPGTTVEEAETRLILMTLEHTRDNKTRAAEILGISLKTLHNKLNKLRGSRQAPRRNPYRSRRASFSIVGSSARLRDSLTVMRLSIRVKQIAGVTAIVGLAVVALSALYTNRLANVVLQESLSRGQMLANTILHRAGGIVTGDVDPYAALREDHGLRSILESSIYGDNITFAAIVDTSGTVIVHSDRAQVGRTLAERADLEAVIDDTPLDKLRVIYRRRRPDARSAPADEASASEDVRLDPRRRLDAADAQAADAICSTDALFTASRGAGDRGVRRGRSRAAPAAADSRPPQRPDASRSRASSASRSICRRATSSASSATSSTPSASSSPPIARCSPGRRPICSRPSNISRTRSRCSTRRASCSSATRRCSTTLPADAIGRVLDGLLPNGHPYRTLVEETLATRQSRGPIQIQGHPLNRCSACASATRPDPRASGPPIVRSPSKPGDDELVMTHAIAGTDGELVGVLLVSRNLAHLSRMQSTLAYSRKLVALGRLTAGIAHEVKNPLNAMMIHLELLRTKIRGSVAAALQPEPVAAAGGTLGLGPRACGRASGRRPGRARARRNHRERNPAAG